jgi:hypothetical protein
MISSEHSFFLAQQLRPGLRSGAAVSSPAVQRGRRLDVDLAD